MHDKEAIEMMGRCVSELNAQRAEIHGLAPQAEAYSVIRGLVELLAPKRGGMVSEDLVWRLERKIEELKRKDEASSVAGEDA